MRRILIGIMVMAGMLTAGQNKEAEKVWQPYKFKGTEHFKYELKVKDEEGKTKKGEYVIDLSKSGEKYKIKFEGSFDGNEGNFTTTVDDPSSISGTLFAQMMFNPWLAPLTTTLFSNAFIAMYAGGALANGFQGTSHWSYKSKEGEKVEFDVEGKCKYAGKDGKHMIMKSNGKTVYELCVAPDVALPLYVKYSDKDDETSTSMELLEYKE